MEQTVNKLKKLVENYDFSAVQWFEQHGGSLRHTMPPERFTRLSEALERYDFEQAAKLLDDKDLLIKVKGNIQKIKHLKKGTPT